jgi:hypothetical protein
MGRGVLCVVRVMAEWRNNIRAVMGCSLCAVHAEAL